MNAIAPGPIETDSMGGTLTEERKAVRDVAIAVEGRDVVGGGSAELLAGGLGSTSGDHGPARRPTGHHDDIASAVDFLLSEGSSYITGQTLNVDGGLYMH